jgi:hypothetical protein
MGKAVLIFLLGSMAIFGVINIFNNNNIKNALNTSVSYYSDTEARNIGNSAMQMVLSQLSDSNSWRVSSASPQTINLFNGSAKYYIKDTSFAGDSLVKVNVYANYRGTQKTITSYFKTPQSVPSFLNYALLTGGNFTVNGGMNVSSPSGGNANIFANGNVNINGNSTIAGFLNYTGTFTHNGFDPSKTITPPVNPNGLPSYGQAPAVAVPNFDPNYFKSIATKTYPPNTSINGLTIPLGTKTNPSIIYVDGDLSLNGVTFTGYGSVCVKGKLNLNGGNINNTNDPQGSPLAFYVVGNVYANGGSNQFNIFTMGQFSYNGSLTVKGSILAGSAGSFNGSLNIVYNPAVSSVLPTSWTVAHRPSDVRYYLE